MQAQLKPLTPGQLAYNEYLNGDHWKKLRQEVFNRDGNRCTSCKTDSQLICHHDFYRKSWYDSIAADCRTLCDPCHKIVHGIAPPVLPVAPSPHLSIYRGPYERPPITNMAELHAARSQQLITRAEYKLRKKLLLNGRSAPNHFKKRKQPKNRKHRKSNPTRQRNYSRKRQMARQAYLSKRRNWSF